MSDVIITLTHGEIVAASAVGLQRQLEALRKGMVDPRAVTDAIAYKHWSGHIEGACAELAFCKAVGIFWPATINTCKHEADIPPNIEVRSRSGGTGKFDNHMIIRTNDHDNSIYVLVIGHSPTYTIKGCIKGRDAKQDKWWGDPNGWKRPAYWVPPTSLYPVHPEKLRSYIFQNTTN